MRPLLENEFNIEKYFSPLDEFISDPYVDSTRKSTKGISSDLFLWARDIINLIKR